MPEPLPVNRDLEWHPCPECHVLVKRQRWYSDEPGESTLVEHGVVGVRRHVCRVQS